MKTPPTHWLLLPSLLGASALAQSPQTDPALLGAAPVAAQAVPGSSSGQVVRWLVRLAKAPIPELPFDERHRGLSPAQSDALRSVEAQERERAYYEAYQAAAGAFDAAHATVVRHLPQIHSLVVDMTPEAAELLGAQPQIATLAPDALMRGQTSTLPPTDGALLAPEHHAARIAHELGHTAANQTSLLAILDYWLEDNYPTGYRAHETLFQGGSAANSSRVLAAANPVGSSQWNGFGNKPWGVDHGVGMAGFAAGAATAQPSTAPLTAGQAPRAGLVSVNITRFWNQNYLCGGGVWNNTGYFSTITDMATSLNWLAANPTVGGTPIRIACLAFGGPTNPDHALSLAVDSMATNTGILVVTPSGNYAANANNPFEAFNQCNGLCVGGAEKTPSATAPHRPDPMAGQGPLSNANTAVPCSAGFFISPTGLALPLSSEPNWRMPNFPGVGDAYRRQYPDLAAISGTSFAAVARNENASLQAGGTSVATAIVAGAATLYLNGPDGGTPQTTSILEAKAAMLATAFNSNPNGLGDNQLGAGFLRTDRLTNDRMTDADTKTGTTSILNRVGQRLQVASFQAIRQTRYSVVLTWFRTNLNPGLVNGQPNWADIDLLVHGSLSGQIANVASRVNPGDTFGNRTWERVEFSVPLNETITVTAVVNRTASGTAPITLGVATATLAPGVSAQPAALNVIPSQTAAPCTVLQTTPSVVYSSLPAGVTFDPIPDSYRQVALGLMTENNGGTTGGNNVVRVELRGRFARSESIPCRLVSAQSYTISIGPGPCPLPPPLTLGPYEAGGSWPSTLVIDAATGVATAEFAAIEGAFGPRFLVFDATPDMAFFMPRPSGLSVPCSFVPWGREFRNTALWTQTAPGTYALRASNQVSIYTCAQWGCGSLYYDLTVTRGAWSNPSTPSLNVTPGLPTLRTTGIPAPGRTYNLVVERGEQGPARNWNVAVVVSDFSSVESPLGPLGCMSIYNPATSFLSDALPFGPSLREGSLSIPIATPLDAALLGQRFFQQAILASDVAGALQLVPTAQVIGVRIGW